MGQSLKKEEKEQAYPVFIKIAGKDKPLTAESIQAYWPNATQEGIMTLIKHCKGNAKHPMVNKYGYHAFLQGGILYAWAQFNPYDDVQEIDYETFEEGLRALRKGEDEEVAAIAKIACARIDAKKTNKITLGAFIEYAMKSYAEERKPWDFIDDKQFLEKNANAVEDEPQPEKKKKKKKKKNTEE